MTSSSGSGVQPRKGKVSLPVIMSVRVGIVGNDAWYARSKTMQRLENASICGVRIQLLP